MAEWLRTLRAGGQYSVADLVRLMITLSDNTATNMLVALVGTKAVDDRMVAYGLTQTRLYRPTFRESSTKIIPRLSQRRSDYLHLIIMSWGAWCQ